MSSSQEEDEETSQTIYVRIHTVPWLLVSVWHLYWSDRFAAIWEMRAFGWQASNDRAVCPLEADTQGALWVSETLWQHVFTLFEVKTGEGEESLTILTTFLLRIHQRTQILPLITILRHVYSISSKNGIMSDTDPCVLSFGVPSHNVIASHLMERVNKLNAGAFCSHLSASLATNQWQKLISRPLIDYPVKTWERVSSCVCVCSNVLMIDWSFGHTNICKAYPTWWLCC